MNYDKLRKERNENIKLIYESEHKVREANKVYDNKSDVDIQIVREQNYLLRSELELLRKKYTDILPRMKICRNPYTNEIVTRSVDIFGLDGFWWNYDSPLRILEDPSPHYILMSGSMKLNKPYDNTKFLVKPGPQVPFVVKEIINHPNVKVVISSIKVGKHIGYPIFYFTDIIGLSIPLDNIWGTNEYYLINPGKNTTWAESEFIFDDYDFDLKPWIKAGKLFWIYPDDETVTLKNSIDDCPYLNLSGSKFNSFIRNGNYWCYNEKNELIEDNEITSINDDESSNIV